MPCKFEEHCLNIFNNILNSIVYCFSTTIYDVITVFITSLLHNHVKQQHVITLTHMQSVNEGDGPSVHQIYHLNNTGFALFSR